MKAAALLAVPFLLSASLYAGELETLKSKDLPALKAGDIVPTAIEIRAVVPDAEKPALKTKDGRTLKYTTYCKIDGSTARGFVNNLGDAFTIDGKVRFYFFDRDGRLIDKEDEYEYEYVSRWENEEVEYTSAPSGADTCAFQIEGAIEGGTDPVEPPPSDAKYVTRCVLDNGTARGWVSNLGDAFEIDGYVWFYFFGADGALLDEEDEYEYEYVGRGDDEEVEYTSAPPDAKTCSFDISKALKRSKGAARPRRGLPGAFAGRKVSWPADKHYDSFRITETCETSGRVSDRDYLKDEAEECAEEKLRDSCDGTLVNGPYTETRCELDDLPSGSTGLVCRAEARGVCRE